MTYILAYLLNLFDLYMTYRLYHRYGGSIEGNPVGRCRRADRHASVPTGSQ